MRENEFSRNPLKAGGWLLRLILVVPVAAALSFTLFFFGPLDLFFNNHEELWFHLNDIMGRVAFTSALFFFCAVFVGMRIQKRKTFRIYVSLLFGLLLGNYIQGNFMNRDYGSLNGTAVNWSAYHSYGIVNTLIWLGCLLIPLVLMRTLREKRMRPVMIFIACALIIMQGTSLAVSRLNYTNPDETATLTTEGIYNLSTKDNTVVFVLDTLDEAYFRGLMKKHPDYAGELSGFTCYDNAMAAGARTPVAMPLIFTGLPRTEPGTYETYINSIWNRQTVFKDLINAGFDVRIFTDSRFVPKSAVPYVKNQKISSSNVSEYGGLNGRLYQLTLYKYVPHFLKRFFWMSTSDFDQYKQQNQYAINDANFYENYKQHGGFTYSDKTEKCFRLYHMMGSHLAYTLQSDGTRSKSKTSLMEQTEGVFHIVLDMLDNMRENGVYERANILIIADHGDQNNAQWATCLYKPSGDTKEYRVSDAPISFLDIAPTIDKIANGNPAETGSGRTLTDIKKNEKRTRTMYWNIGNNSTFIIGQHESTAHASDADAMKLVKQYRVLDANSAEPYKLGTTLYFTADKTTANVYCTHGFRTVSTKVTRMEGHNAQMVFPIENPPKKGNLEVHFSYFSVNNESNMIVSVDGKKVCEHNMVKSSNQETLVFKVPVKSLKRNKLTLDFTFTDIPESEEEKEPGTRMQTVRATKLIITAEE